MLTLGKYGCAKTDEFSENFQSGGWGIFQSKNLFSRFWELYTRLFEIKLKFHPPPTPQNGLYLWKSCACISYYLALVPPYIYSTISIIKKLKHNFPKMRGGVKDRMELIWSNVAPSRALLGQCSGAGSGLLEESMSLLLTPLKKKRRVDTIENMDFTVHCLL